MDGGRTILFVYEVDITLLEQTLKQHKSFSIAKLNESNAMSLLTCHLDRLTVIHSQLYGLRMTIVALHSLGCMHSWYCHWY